MTFGVKMALFEAIRTGDLEVVILLLQDKTLATEQYLELAVSSGHLEIVKILLAIPAVKDNAAVRNNAILKLAIANDRVEITRVLLEIPVINNAAVANSEEMLRWAASHGNLEVIKLLLKIPSIKEKLVFPPVIREEFSELREAFSPGITLQMVESEEQALTDMKIKIKKIDKDQNRF